MDTTNLIWYYHRNIKKRKEKEKRKKKGKQTMKLSEPVDQLFNSLFPIVTTRI